HDVAYVAGIPAAELVRVGRKDLLDFVVDITDAEIGPDLPTVVPVELHMELVDGGFLVTNLTKCPLRTEIRLFENSVRVASGKVNQLTADHGAGRARTVGYELDGVGYRRAEVHELGSDSLAAEGDTFAGSTTRVIAAGGRFAMGGVDVEFQRV